MTAVRRIWTSFLALLSLAAAAGPLEIASGLDTLASRLAASCDDKGLARIAVLEFTDLNGDVDDLGLYAAEELLSRLVPDGRVEVVDRRAVRQVLEDENLPVAAMLAPIASDKLKRTLKLDAVVTGAIVRLAGAIRLSARVISVPTGVITAVAVVDIVRDSFVDGLLHAAPFATPVPGFGARLEGEDMRVKTKSGGIFELQYTSRWGNGWSNNAHGWWRETRLGDRLTLSLPVAQPGMYRLSAQLTKSWNYGNVQFHLDGRKLGSPFLGYAPNVVPSGVIELGTMRLAAGDHDLLVELVGDAKEVKHDASGLGFALDYIELTPIRRP